MSSLERFKETAYFGRSDRVFMWPQWIDKETLRRWRGEGILKDVYSNTYFGFDRLEYASINLDLVPVPESRVIEEDRDTAVYLG